MREFFDDFLTCPTPIVLLVVAFLVSIVAAVGILVSIYNSVSARMREIALIRALGATRARVLLLICVEAGLIGLFGGILGLITGHLLGAVASYIFNIWIGEGINWIWVTDQYRMDVLTSRIRCKHRACLPAWSPALKSGPNPGGNEPGRGLRYSCSLFYVPMGKDALSLGTLIEVSDASLTASVILLLLWATPCPDRLRSQTTPAHPRQRNRRSAALELRATESFNKGDFAAALPMLQKLATQLQTQPNQNDKLAMVQEQIRVCQKNQATSLQSTGGAAVTSLGDTSRSLPPQLPQHRRNSSWAPIAARTPTPKPGEILEMSIKELGNFDFDADTSSTPIPPDVKNLNGSTIRSPRLHMIPMDQAENISKFALVPSLFACCYGQPPQIQHTIVVSCLQGQSRQLLSR